MSALQVDVLWQEVGAWPRIVSEPPRLPFPMSLPHTRVRTWVASTTNEPEVVLAFVAREDAGDTASVSHYSQQPPLTCQMGHSVAGIDARCC